MVRKLQLAELVKGLSGVMNDVVLRLYPGFFNVHTSYGGVGLVYMGRGLFDQELYGMHQCTFVSIEYEC